tara:strand:+ start:138 stop:974 length:837 start_codon:yes stop_codon:yes gene_type:complete
MMFLNLPFMGDSSKEKTKNEIYESTPDFFKADPSAFLEALGAPAGASDDTISELIAALTPATQDRDDPNFFESLLGGLLGGKKSSGINLGQLGLSLGLASLLKDRGAFDPDIAPVGYQGEVPRYTAIREQVTGRDDTNRRPGSGGRRYFSDVIYAKAPEGQEPMSVEEARAAAKAQAAGFMGGGSVLQGGGYLQGDSDGQADLIPADIDGVQEARLSHGEFVLPADVVAMLGNGNSDAGAEALDEFMSMVRTKATGTPKQQKNIDADKVLMMLSKKAG